MANLVPVPGSDPVPQLETNTRARGGPGGIMNAQAQALLNNIADIESTNGASRVGITDAGNYYTSDNVEGALQEAGSYKNPYFPTYLPAISAIKNAEPVSLLLAANPNKWDAIQAGTDVTDYSDNINSILDDIKTAGGGQIVLPRGTMYAKNLILGDRTLLSGQGSGASRLMFPPGATIVTDDAVIKVQGAYWGIEDVALQAYADSTTQEAATTGHVLQIVPASVGIKGKITRCDLSFAGQDIINIVSNSNPSYELVVNGSELRYANGLGINPGAANDSRLTDSYISFCRTGAFHLLNMNTAWKMSNVKMYANRMGTRSGFAWNRVIPKSQTEAGDLGTLVLTGVDHTLSNVEIQENGSIGLQLGYSDRTLSNSVISGLSVSGNGGYTEIGTDDGYGNTTDATIQSNYRRVGIFGVNYYNVKISGECNDFRAKYAAGRQYKGIKILGGKVTKTSGSIYVQSWWKIVSVAGGADFTNVQPGYAYPTNSVDGIFQARNTSPSGSVVTPTSYGSGSLTAVNDKLNLDLVILNQYDQDNNLPTSSASAGYSLQYDGGNSYAVVNGAVVAGVLVKVPGDPRIVIKQAFAPGATSGIQLVDASNNGIGIIGDQSGTAALRIKLVSGGVEGKTIATFERNSTLCTLGDPANIATVNVGFNTLAGTTAPSAGGAGALPATPAGYATIKVNGVDRKLPYY